MNLTEIKEIEINVTQEDIEKGVRNDAMHCPIARAFSRALEPHNLNIGTLTVQYEDVLFGNKEAAASYDLPQEAGVFVLAFDHNDQVKPFRFKAKLNEHSGCQV